MMVQGEPGAPPGASSAPCKTGASNGFTPQLSMHPDGTWYDDRSSDEQQGQSWHPDQMF